MITIVPEGGLCNRMRSIASCYLLAQSACTSLRVKWYLTEDLNCRFDDIFDVTGLPMQVEQATLRGRLSKLKVILQEQAGQLFGTSHFGPADTLPGKFPFSEVADIAQKRDILIRTNSRLIKEDGMYNMFKPSAQVRDAMQPYASKLEHSVGVHIRRTDNVQAIANSPISMFVEAMRSEMEQHPDTAFFVATDNADTFKFIQDEIGSAVYEHPKASYSRNDPRAIKDAAVDLFALSSCRSLIGSYWSSFTDTAWELGNIPFVIIKGE